jgi:uracil phosphoribosyltransferase
MLATGGSAADAVSALDAEGAEQVTVLSVVGTQQGIDRVTAQNPGVRVVIGAIDPQLDDDRYIVPGLGDFGDRLFGTPH